MYDFSTDYTFKTIELVGNTSFLTWLPNEEIGFFPNVILVKSYCILTGFEAVNY